MLRLKWTWQRASLLCPTFHRLAAAAVTLAVSGCSADVARFNSPMFGLTESPARSPAAPLPREGMRTAAPGSYAESAGYDYPAGGRSGDAAAAPTGPRTYDQAPAQPPASYPQASNQPTPSQSAFSQPASYKPQHHEPAPLRQASQPLPYRTAPAPAPIGPTAHSAPAAGPVQTAASEPPPMRTPASSPVASSAAAGGDAIEVQQGDTIYGLAQRHRVSISELMSTNGLRNPNLHPGQKLMLPARASRASVAQASRPLPKAEPTPSASPAPAPLPVRPSPAVAPEAVAEAEGSYTVKNGDSLYAVAVRHKVPLAELQRLNGISDPTRVKPGTILKIPSAGARTAVAAVAPMTAPSPAPAPTVAPAPAPAPMTLSTGTTQLSPKPVIINAPPAVQSSKVGALGQSETATDAGAAPAPAATQAAPQASLPQLSLSASDADGKGKGADAGNDQNATPTKLRWPVKGKIIAAFGARPDGQSSDGIKLAVPLGTEVHAAEAGVVAYAGSELKGYGNLVLLRHDNGWITAYAHNEELEVKRGDRVKRGQVIAKAGKTGSVDQPQVHFELRQGSSPVDPIPYLEKL